MAETLSLLSIISFIVSGVAFVLAIVLWVSFKIPRVIGDLSGHNARKSIAKVRASNEKSGDKSYHPSGVNAARVKLTSNMTQAQTEQHTEEIQKSAMQETGILADNKAEMKNTVGTELLSEKQTQLRENTAQKKVLHILEEIVLIHTDEVIE